MDGFASDEEQMQKLRQLALSLEKSIFTTESRALPSVKLDAFSPVRSVSPGPVESSLRGRSTEAREVKEVRALKQTPMMLIQDLEEETIYDRLYNMAKKKPEPKPVEEKIPPKFKRKPTEWDMNLRDKRRDLYIDAECRRRVLQEKILEKDKQAEESSRSIKTAPSSQAMARRRKVRELKELFSRYSTKSNDASMPLEDRQHGKMSYAALRSALSDLGFLSTKGTEEDEALTDNTWCAMHQVQAPYSPPSVYIHFPGFVKVVLSMLDKRGESRSRSASVGSGRRAQSVEGSRTRSVSPASLHGKKRQTAISRQLAEPNAVKRQFGRAEEDTCTFNPAINNNSRRLLRTRSGGPGYLRLSNPATSTKERKLETVRKEKMEMEQKECTFQPTINRIPHGRVREEMYMQPVARRPRDEPVSKEEIALQECTFEPKVNPYRKIRNQPLPNGYFETIKRLREHRADNRTFEDKLRDTGNLGGYSQKHAMRKTAVKPFTFALDKKLAREKPLMYLDIQLPKGKKGRIGIHANDTAVGLAKSFASTYQLDPAMESKLMKVLEHHIETLVPRLVAKREGPHNEEGKRVAAEFAESVAQVERYAHDVSPGRAPDDVSESTEAMEVGLGLEASMGLGMDMGMGLDIDEADLRDIQQWSDDDDNADLKAVLGDDLKVALDPQPYTDNLVDSLKPNPDGIEALFEEIRQMEEQYGIRS